MEEPSITHLNSSVGIGAYFYLLTFDGHNSILSDSSHQREFFYAFVKQQSIQKRPTSLH